MLGIKKRSAGEFVPGGTYFNTKAMALTNIPEGGDYLPEGEGATYYRAPILLVLALGPMAGLAFILFLPIAVPVLGVYALVKAIRRGMGRRAEPVEARVSH